MSYRIVMLILCQIFYTYICNITLSVNTIQATEKFCTKMRLAKIFQAFEKVIKSGLIFSERPKLFFI